ncbi:MAG: hypothetical protein AAB931_00375 [Patescibacteria group bacterium]
MFAVREKEVRAFKYSEEKKKSRMRNSEKKIKKRLEKTRSLRL